jgi:hypothetical protein
MPSAEIALIQHRDDLKGLEEAIRQAKDNPIDGYTRKLLPQNEKKR